MIHIVDTYNECIALYVDKKLVATGHSYRDLFGQSTNEDLAPYLKYIVYNESLLNHSDDDNMGFPENFDDLNFGVSHAT